MARMRESHPTSPCRREGRRRPKQPRHPVGRLRVVSENDHSTTGETDGVLSVRPLDVGTWPAFARLVEANNGSPEELPQIKSRRRYEQGLTDLPDWRSTCFFTGKGRRHGRGLTGGDRRSHVVRVVPAHRSDGRLREPHPHPTDLPAPLGGHPYRRRGLTLAIKPARAHDDAAMQIVRVCDEVDDRGQPSRACS